jgi:VanZ family protein
MTQPAQPALAVESWPRRLLRWCVRWRHGLGLLAVLAVFMLSSIPNTHPPRIRGLDKMQHVGEYFALGLVFLNVATRGYARLRLPALLGTWLAVVAVSLVDETYQRWIPGRSFDLWDVAASATGGLVALGVAVLLHVVALQPDRSRS